MEANLGGTGRLPAAFLTPGSSSFIDFLAQHQPDLLPGSRKLPAGLTIEAPHAYRTIGVIPAVFLLIAGGLAAIVRAGSSRVGSSPALGGALIGLAVATSALNDLTAQKTAEPATIDFTAKDGVRHSAWVLRSCSCPSFRPSSASGSASS